MGDRCHMTIYCRPQDTARFEELGFTAQIPETAFNDGTVEMLDEEANYAHHGSLPTDIPWTGSHHEGGNYGPAELHCPGEGRIWEWETNTNHSAYCFSHPITDSHDFITEILQFNAFYEAYLRTTHLLCPPAPDPASSATNAA
jgi:hypothetical protein